MKSIQSLLSVMAIVGIIFFSSCGSEDLPPNTALIKGTVTMENIDVWESWVDSGEVQLTIFPEFSLNPPAGWGEIPNDVLGPGVPGGTFAIGAPFNSQNPIILEFEEGKTEFDFEIEVDPGTYSALAVGFRHDFVEDASKRSATLGVYHNNADEVSHGWPVWPVRGQRGALVFRASGTSENFSTTSGGKCASHPPCGE